MANLARGTSVVASLTLISRVLGFFREILIARLFGAGISADAYFVAFRIPNLLRSVFAEGAFTSAFVPVFSSDLHGDRNKAMRTFQVALGFLLLSTGIVVLLGILFSEEIINAIAPGFSLQSDRHALASSLTSIMMPYICFVSVIALINGALNSVSIFGASALAQVIMNIVLIGGTVVAGYYSEKEAAYILAISVILGGVIQVVSQLPALKRAQFRLKPIMSFKNSSLPQILRLMVPALLGAAVYQISIFLSTQLASLLPIGSISWLSYADRVAQLPIGVFSIALSSVLLPTLSTAYAEKDSASFTENLLNALRYTSIIVIPMAAFIALNSESLAIILYQRGSFDRHSSHMTAYALTFFSLGLWQVSCHSLLVRAFNAQKDTKTPTIVGCMSLLLTFVFSILLMGPISQNSDSTLAGFITQIQESLNLIGDFPAMGHAGLALASTLSFTCAFFLLLVLFRKSYGSINFGKFVKSTAYALVCSIFSLVFCLVPTYFLKDLAASDSSIFIVNFAPY